MVNEIALRKATLADAEPISALVTSLAPFFLADPDDAEAAEPFFDTITRDAIRGYLESDRFRYHVAEVDGEVIGTVATRDDSHLYHLFVDERFHGRGFAKQLWTEAKRAARAAGHAGPFTVNSSRYAVPVYERLGFVATGPEVRKDGLAFVPMVLDEAAPRPLRFSNDVKFLDHYFAADGPGVALAAIPDHGEPRIECHGLADIEERTPITSETPFELASASKWFTATAVLLLVEREGLDLRSPVHEHLPYFETVRAPRPVTLRDLLWHTSGLVDYLEDGGYTPAEERTKAFVLANLPRWSEEATPGREHRYSNTNYVVLARVVESVVGGSFAEFLETRLFAPFGLRHTIVDPLGTRARAAIGYQNLGYGYPHFEPAPTTPIDTDGDGGILSTLDDLVRWQSLFWNGEVLRPESVRETCTPGRVDSGESFPYGYGLQVEGHGSGEAWGHGGSWTSATTLLGRYVDAGVAVTVLSNEVMAPVERISQRAFALAT